MEYMWSPSGVHQESIRSIWSPSGVHQDAWGSVTYRHCQWENVWIMEGERRSLRLSKNVRSEGAENTINHSHKLVQLFIPVAAQMTSVQGENGEIARDVTKTV